MIKRLLPLLLLASCGPKLEAGTVIDMHYEPEHTTTVIMPIKAGDITTYIPTTTTHDEKWTITIEDLDRKRQLRVTESDYNAVALGDWWATK